MSLPDGVSFRPSALAGCTSVTDDTDIQTYIETDRPREVTSVAVGGIKGQSHLALGGARCEYEHAVWRGKSSAVGDVTVVGLYIARC